MKNLILFLSIFLVSLLSAQAQNDRYTATMTTIVEQMNAPAHEVDWQDISNRLERIAQAEQDRWLPSYYLGYVALQQALFAREKGEIDRVMEHVGRAETYLAQARALTPENSELKCLEGYIYQGYLWIDPMGNGPTYSPLAHQAYAAAAALDPTNPRPIALQGMLVLFTPEFFGGGADKALPILQKSQALYAAEAETDKGIQPQWGGAMNEWMRQKAERDLAAKQ